MKKRGKIAAAAVMILLAAALVYSVCAGTVTVAGLLGAADIDPVKVERIEFTKNRETQQIWRSEDYDVRKSVCDFLNNAHCIKSLSPTAYGGEMTVNIYYREPINGAEYVSVSLQSKNVIEGSRFAGANSPMRNYRIIFGGYSSEDWDAILQKCERVN